MITSARPSCCSADLLRRVDHVADAHVRKRRGLRQDALMAAAIGLCRPAPCAAPSPRWRSARACLAQDVLDEAIALHVVGHENALMARRAQRLDDGRLPSMKSAMFHDPSYLSRVDPGMASHGTLLIWTVWQIGTRQGSPARIFFSVSPREGRERERQTASNTFALSRVSRGWER